MLGASMTVRTHVDEEGNTMPETGFVATIYPQVSVAQGPLEEPPVGSRTLPEAPKNLENEKMNK